MRKYLVKITKIAEDEIRSIFQYLIHDNPSASAKWVEEIEHQIDSLERFPNRCPIIPESKQLGKEYRHIIYGNYRTIFRTHETKIIIMRVIHGARLLDLGMFDK